MGCTLGSNQTSYGDGRRGAFTLFVKKDMIPTMVGVRIGHEKIRILCPIKKELMETPIRVSKM